MLGSNAPVERWTSMHRRMVLIRAFEEAAGEAWHAGEVRGSVHQYIGQEAIAVGVCANLRGDDYISSYHRGHGHALAKGADPARMMAELFGRAGGTCGGKGGSMHIADFAVGMLGANGVVADGVTIAVGAAQAVKLLRQDKVVVAFFGDGAMNRGPLLEALNWAMVYRLPILFVCEDNLYSATTRTTSVTSGDAVSRAAGFGMRTETSDGNDVAGVDALFDRLVPEVRAGAGPMFVHLSSYRWRGHFAPDKALYRDPAEHARLMADDPIARCEAMLAAQGVPRQVFRTTRDEIEHFVKASVEAARGAPWPEGAAAWSDVQDLGAPEPATFGVAA